MPTLWAYGISHFQLENNSLDIDWAMALASVRTNAMENGFEYEQKINSIVD